MRIVQSIEELRKQLVELGTIKGLQDPEVIRLSQKLDKVINAYYRRTRRTIYCSNKIINKKRLTKSANYVTEYQRRTIPYHPKVVRDY